MKLVDNLKAVDENDEVFYFHFEVEYEPVFYVSEAKD